MDFILGILFIVFLVIILLISHYSIHKEHRSSYDKTESKYKKIIEKNTILELKNLRSTQFSLEKGGNAKTDLYLTPDALFIMVRQSFITTNYLISQPRILTRKHLNKSSYPAKKINMNSIGGSVFLQFHNNRTLGLKTTIDIRIWDITPEQKELILNSIGGSNTDGLYLY